MDEIRKQLFQNWLFLLTIISMPPSASILWVSLYISIALFAPTPCTILPENNVSVFNEIQLNNHKHNIWRPTWSNGNTNFHGVAVNEVYGSLNKIKFIDIKHNFWRPWSIGLHTGFPGVAINEIPAKDPQTGQCITLNFFILSGLGAYATIVDF